MSHRPLARRTFARGVEALAASLLLCPLAAAAQAPDSLAHARAVYQYIERHRASYRHDAGDMELLGLEQQSTDGGKLEAYCDSTGVRLFVAHYYGETGDATDWLYLEHGSLVFALTEVRRGIPNGRDPYPKRTIVEYYRSYFAGDHQIAFLDAKKRRVSLESGEAKKNELDMLADVRRFSAVMPGCRPTVPKT